MADEGVQRKPPPGFAIVQVPSAQKDQYAQAAYFGVVCPEFLHRPLPKSRKWSAVETRVNLQPEKRRSCQNSIIWQRRIRKGRKRAARHP